ncbi:FAD/NAD(P)-binding protein [Nocardioides sp.]|uniref:NAD(P)-binding protein n=1 Tax=Nocardioides sp. TaxID=35761 RepID=UPI001A2ED40F|nr:FAD/NAD(P)-binding protein [Nocardioides sp.]MBJ7356489.1 NAD(P)-binding protein [Nocardioides sp.]
MVTVLDADYVVVGAGAVGMAFTDALVDHADVTVALVDRRHGPGGHWLDAYPFVQLHQASAFYGVASTLLGGGRIQQDGPERGLHERATAPEIRDYYDRVLRDRLLATRRVTFHPGTEHSQVRPRPGARVVDTTYLSPMVPATTPPPFAVAAEASVVPVNRLADLGGAPSQYVVVGSGKTATDACVWLLGEGTDPDDICWIRPREPWMLNRAVVQPDPAVFIGMAADTMEAATVAATPDDLFLDLEDRGIMLRIDRAVTPTMAKTPTLATWELDLLRTIEHVVRLGHLERVEPGRLLLEHGEVSVARDAVVVHCAASGLPRRPPLPIWAPDAIRPQPIRSGFPCFGAALAGFVEATVDGDAEKNRLCPSSPFSDTPADWAAMQVLGGRAARAFSSDPAIRSWAGGVSLNLARVPPDRQGDADVVAATDRFTAAVGPGLARLAELAGIAQARR